MRCQHCSVALSRLSDGSWAHCDGRTRGHEPTPKPLNTDELHFEKRPAMATDYTAAIRVLESDLSSKQLFVRALEAVAGGEIKMAEMYALKDEITQLTAALAVLRERQGE